MTENDTGGQAFPLLFTHATTQTGMTLRDYFAAKAMQGIMANPDDDWGNHTAIADIAYGMADAMLEARSV